MISKKFVPKEGVPCIIHTVIIVVVIGLIAMMSLRRLLTEALYSRFEKTLAAEVYELKFKNVDVNPFNGTYHHREC
jgi:hypothetical protein